MCCVFMVVICLHFKKLLHCYSFVDEKWATSIAFSNSINTPPLLMLPTLASQHSATLSITQPFFAVQIQAMQPGEVAGLRYLPTLNPNPHQPHFSTMQNNLPSFHFGRFLTPTSSPHFQIPAPFHEFTPQMPSLSNNSTSDEAEEHQLSVIDERKQRRMISNRESARRSRMRKQKHLDELWSQVIRLRAENRQLIDKLNHVSECHDQVLRENILLREETSDLRLRLRDLQLDIPYSVLRELDGVPCNTAHLRAESTNQPSTTSMDLLH
ncbi:uncharacterized protein LOC143879276 [Tasmannia lanceolata]|uniref:uncharacterized protein LOC143879276 n=1 Tax=Tasmannia lanceolata TaxID=3420 RepID=UPI00406492DE